MCVHSIMWKHTEEDPFAERSCQLSRKISKLPTYGTISHAKSCGSLIVANLSKFDPLNAHKFRILLVDSTNCKDIIIDPEIPQVRHSVLFFSALTKV
jgi:hypothetical protein